MYLTQQILQHTEHQSFATILKFVLLHFKTPFLNSKTKAKVKIKINAVTKTNPTILATKIQGATSIIQYQTL